MLVATGVLVIAAGPALTTAAGPAFAEAEGQDDAPADEDAPADTDEGASADDEDAPAPTTLFGTLRGGDGTVADVELMVTDADGQEVGVAVTDDAGMWELEVPGAGDYTVMIGDLPDDVILTDPEATSIEVTITEGSRRAVPIPLGEAAESSGFTRLLAQQTLQGLRFGLIIAMAAVGLSLIFGTTGLINFAHGELVVFGAVAAWFFNATGWQLPLLVAGVLGTVVAGALGGVLDRGVFRPLRQRRVGLFQLLVVTIGLSLVLRFLIQIFFGGQPRNYTDFIGQQVNTYGPFAITPRDMIIMAASTLVLVLVALALLRTRTGKAMRAVADNRDLAESSGIDVQRIIGIVWISGAALAGLGGIFYGSTISVDYLFGFQLLLLMFAGVILGGLGTAFGAMVGSLVVGLVTELSAVWFPNELKYAWALGVLVLVLLVRPQGLLGRRERIG
jgi:branched-chain amino acid transport system permease protein